MAEEIAAQILSIVGAESIEDRTVDYLGELEKEQKRAVFEMRTKHLGQTGFGQSKVVNIGFSQRQVERYGSLELHQLTDMQFGHKSCKLKRVAQFMEMILERENRFVLMTGDNVDAATSISVGSPWDNWFEPQSEIYRFCKIFSRIRHRILGYVGGNHERRSIPTFGDLGFLIATMLRLPYSAGQQFVNINFGEHDPFKIHLWHGLPRARTKGALAQILDRFMQKSDSQLYLTGHNHQAMVIPEFRQQHSYKTQTVRLRKIMVASGTSFLEFWGTYAEIMGLSASDTLMPYVVLTPDGKWKMVLE